MTLFRTLWGARNLIANLVRRDLTVRYKSTVLGLFWSFAKPLALMTIYMVIFGKILGLRVRQDGIPYGLHVLAGVLPWTFFVGATSEAMNSIISNANLVKKVKLPLAVFPTSAVCSHAVHFALAMAVVVVAMLIVGLIPSPLFLLVPLVFLLQCMVILSLALLLSSLNVYFRDVASIWEVVASGWFYATPIIYPAYYATEYFSERGMNWAQWLYLANPMAPITIAYRRLTLYASVDVPQAVAEGASAASPALQLELSDPQLVVSIGIATAIAAGFLWISHAVFCRLSPRFADEL